MHTHPFITVKSDWRSKMEEGMRMGDAVMSEEGTSLQYKPLPMLGWGMSPPGEEVEMDNYCYMCQKPHNGKYSNEYQRLKSILKSATEADKKDVCEWASNFYNKHVRPHTNKEMTPLQFQRHIEFHEIDPVEIQVDLVRKARMLSNQYLREAIQFDPDKGDFQAVKGERAKLIFESMKGLREQNLALYRMRQNSSV